MQIIGYFFPFILKLQSVQIAKSKLTGQKAVKLNP